MKIPEKNIFKKNNISVDFFYKSTKDKFFLELLTPKVSLDKLITEQNLHRPGLALAGFVESFTYKRVQIYGNTEVKYLKKLSKKERESTLEKIFSFDIPCIVFTNDNFPSPDILKIANKHKIPVFKSPFTTTKLSYLISDFLDDQFAPRITLHGSFVDVYGVGLFIAGKSGIGKSEVALDLVERGHRLVADDVVILTKKGENILMGSGTELVKHFMEIRGIGIIDIKSIFGIRAIRFQKRLEVIIELEVWDKDANYTRTGLDTETINLLDVEIQYIKVPIVPGKNITVISEVIALNYLLQHYGYNAADVLKERLKEKIKLKSESINRAINYFEHDFE